MPYISGRCHASYRHVEQFNILLYLINNYTFKRLGLDNKNLQIITVIKIAKSRALINPDLVPLSNFSHITVPSTNIIDINIKSIIVSPFYICQNITSI